MGSFPIVRTLVLRTSIIRLTACFYSLTTEYNLELVYRKPFLEIWHEEKDDPELGPLSERMGVRARGGGELLVSDEELDAASKYFVVECGELRLTKL